MGVESYLVLWVFTNECCHPNRFRVELMLIESFEIGRLDFPNRDTLKSTHCFLPNETEISHGRVSWQTHWTNFYLAPLASSIGEACASNAVRRMGRNEMPCIRCIGPAGTKPKA
jgi:hypothetical protein